MRDAKSADNVVAARLRSALAGPTGGWAVAGPVVLPPAGRVVPFVAPPAPPPVSALSELAEVGEPLSWSDIIPGWPDDVDLPPVSAPPASFSAPPIPVSAPPDPISAPPVPISAPPVPVEHGSLAELGNVDRAVREATNGFPVVSAWATPPQAPRRVDRSAPPVVLPLDGPSERDPLSSQLGDLMAAAEPPADGVTNVAPPSFGAPGYERRPLAPPAWVLQDDGPHDFGAQPAAPMPRSATPRSPLGGSEWPLAEDDDGPAELSSAGAFGGGTPDGGRRFGLGAFDPGRRGVRALAVVAVLVILVAAFLAWRSRPEVDPVTPPAFDVSASAGDKADPVVAVPGGDASSGAAEVVVSVAGKVRKPGLVRLPAGARVADAVGAAGGADPGVDVALLNLARKVVDGELILVGVTPPPGVATAPAAAAGGAAGPGGGPAGGPVNLNTATLADLDTLPGVGPVLAQRILAARDAQGGFQAVTDLRKVDGIGDARYEQLKDLVSV